ncbi:hypothetical protein L3i22_068120 [Actinoplanes sp. L3-i22]|nr:hypothetical protein L3i22_068120 [Actinoplanes sp. L3-i22]
MLSGVLVAAELVGSSGFRAETGKWTTLSLESYGARWSPASDRAASAVEPTELLLTGVLLPFARPCLLGGWVLDVDGVPIHVGASPPDAPLPRPGQRVEVRGPVGVADDYVVDEVQRALQRRTAREWLVRRIVRHRPFTAGGVRRIRPEVVPSIRHTADTSSYLIDLRAP